MARGWLDERLAVLISRLAELTAEQETEIAQLCADEIADWKARPQIKKVTALRPVMTAVRKALREQPKVTPENRYRNPCGGQYEHIALKHLNFTPEEWDEMNAISNERFETRLQNQQLIDQYQEVIARAEKLLQSDRLYDLVTGLAIITGRRLTEILKTGRLFPKSGYTLVFDGQLKRRDLDLKPYEIPILAPAELVLAAWQKVRALEDTSKLDNEQVAQKHSKLASALANQHFNGLIPLRSEKEDLYTHAFRAVYVRLAVLFYCPTAVNELVYVNAILGHYQATDEQKRRDYAATAHYFDYRIGPVSRKLS